MSQPRSVLLLHGVQSSRMTWWRVGADLADLGWQVQALDLLGHGERAGHGPARLSIEVLAADVLEQLAGPVDLVVGHSLGAIVALTVAQRAPEFSRAIVAEEPPLLNQTLDPRQVADQIDQSVQRARADPDAVRAQQLVDNPLWSAIDADHEAYSVGQLDLGRITAMLRSDQWDLAGLVESCPIPVSLLAATTGSALTDPERSALLDRLPQHRRAVIISGHSIHRDRPGLWLYEVLRFAAEAAPG